MTPEETEALLSIVRIYEGSDGEATSALYARLEERGAVGQVAVNLFRAHKASARAKVYRGRSYRGQAYDRKDWALRNVCRALEAHAAALGITWGWGVDEEQPRHRHVLYVDLPTGQLSFHTGACGDGPEYAGTWDGMRGAGADRLCRWIARLLEMEAA